MRITLVFRHIQYFTHTVYTSISAYVENETIGSPPGGLVRCVVPPGARFLGIFNVPRRPTAHDARGEEDVCLTRPLPSQLAPLVLASLVSVYL